TEAGGIVPEKWYSFGYRQQGLKRVMLLVDQSASMADSVVYAGIYACVLAQVRSLSTLFILFDTAVVDLSSELHDPVGVLFASQLGGGTNITRALKYASDQIEEPNETHLFLISDLDEGGSREGMLQQMDRLRTRGVHMQVLLNLSDEGKPHFSSEMAEAVANLDIPAFACTPDRFPELIVQQLYKGAD
ncbi:MAG: VWA domain-containing protein, partial [Bacteroidetes bacterium]|nr:VWA domain-containing protein [Bacteroidota bacterium]